LCFTTRRSSDLNGNGGEVYALFNNTPNPVKALHNCWIEGQESTEEDVEGVIAHIIDDPALGEGFFDPFECGIPVMATNDFNQNLFNIYPNPASRSFFIDTKETGHLNIYDMSGKKVLSQKDLNGKTRIQINLPKGIYLVEFENGTERSTRKLIVN